MKNFTNALAFALFALKLTLFFEDTSANLSSESCHLDQNQKRKVRPSFFDFRLKLTDLIFSNAKHWIALRLVV